MENISDKDSLEQYQRKMAHNRRVRAQAQAMLKRARNAGIPPKFMRIKQPEFKKMLDNYYHKDVDKISDFVYNHPLELLKKEFIVVDGGGVIERQKAVFAILFRLIACDKYGIYWKNSNLCHHMQNFNANLDGYYRDDTAEQLSKMDLVAISEVLMKDFRETSDTGRYYDDFLGYRDDHIKTTIISFTNPLALKQSAEDEKNSWTNQDRFGQYLCLAAQSDQFKRSNFYRIRVAKK